jgi:hypothetical protein
VDGGRNVQVCRFGSFPNVGRYWECGLANVEGNEGKLRVRWDGTQTKHKRNTAD